MFCDSSLRMVIAMLLLAMCFAAQASGQLPLELANLPQLQSPPDKIAVNEKQDSNKGTAECAVDGPILQVGCSSCGSGPAASGLMVESGGCVNGCCVPGRTNPCCDHFSDSCYGKICSNIVQCICCPDPCYEPRWIALADSAFFADAPRPITQMKLRWDSGWNMPRPDKAEFYFARGDGNGKGPNVFGRSIDYKELSLYTEAAAGPIGVFVEMPYRNVQVNNPVAGEFAGHSGFADMNIGTKSLLLDCELLLVSFQFRTYIPTGSPGQGLSTGHVSLEPSLLAALKLTPTTYLQSQFAYWIPIGGDTAYQGPVFHYHFSLNQLLYRCCNVQFIGTLELDGWDIQGGAFTDAAGNPQSAKSSVGDIISMGPGLRMVICDKIDFGVGSRFNLSDPRRCEDVVRAEFRWRF